VKRLLLVLPAIDRDRANQDALQWDPTGGTRSFTVGLSSTGLEPATHFWASSVVSDAACAAIAAKVATDYPLARCEEWDIDADPQRPNALLAELGLRRLGMEGLA